MGSVSNFDDTVYGRRLLPVLLDRVAHEDPDRELLQIPRSAEPADGCKTVTWKAMANAVNRCAHKIVQVCGKPERDTFPTIAYLGPNDARYIVMMIACIKAGYKVLFISPRNSTEGQVNLFNATDCKTIAFAHPYHDVIQPWLEGRDMQAIEVSPIDAWFPDKEVPHFPWIESFDKAQWEPMAVLHTSGSTGLPKPINIAHGAMAVSDAYHNLPEWEGRTIAMRAWAESANRLFLPMPLFHMAGLLCTVTLAFYWDTPIVLGIAERPLTADFVAESLESIDVQSVMLPPAIVEDMSQTEEGLRVLSRMKTVAFGGGNLAREAGNRLLKAGVNMHNLIGATEFAPFPTYTTDTRDLWQWFAHNPDVFGCEFRRQSGDDDVYEMVIVRKPENRLTPGYQGIFYTFPELDEWSTKDLYRPHPTHAHHWIYHGRADNIIVFSNGEKLNPVTIEEIVSDHPAIKGALVVGTQRFQAGLIVEPVVAPATEDAKRALLDSVWPLVEVANRETVAHGRIARDMVALSNPDKPFARAGKGTIQRATTVKLYADEIEAMYQKEAGDDEVAQLDVHSEEGLARSIVDTLRKRLAASKLDVDVDFFAAGIDSLGIMSAAKMIRAGLKEAGHDVDAAALKPRVIYTNSTPRKLASHIITAILQGQDGSVGEDEQQQRAMADMHRKYTADLTKAAPGRPDALATGQTVVLTGSTGMLGSYLLDQMGRNAAVARIVCLNRAADGGRAQQEKALADRGLSLDTLATKAEFHHADLSRPDLGLPADVLDRLRATADRVIHNAWPVNFNIPIESFEPSIAGVRYMADLAATASKRVAVTFISSIAVADRWDPAARGGVDKVPEGRLEDTSLPSGGYGRSKMVGSLIVEDAAAKEAGDFPFAVVRVGQVAGPEAEAGMWNRQEWLPSIVASSLYMGALPSDLGSMDRVDWTPAERIAALVLEAAGVTRAASTIDGYYHGVNPHAVGWSSLAGAVQDFYGRDRIAELVPFGAWVDRLERTAGHEADVARNPGVKLVDSYRAMAMAPRSVVYDMQRTVERCPVVQGTRAVTPALMQHWCRQWGF